ncbi:MAG: hypothetical protein P4L27_07515, partial [Ignavibacteriaceae bacterium]|nr:hypothetical protein [Ignavibacteriaceae bacterium]
ALGLILAQDPDLLILDDYSMGLDAGYRRLFLDYLIEYAKAESKTIFITSHIIQDLENFLDDCLIIDYKSVLIAMPIKEFQKTFKQFRFTANNPDISLSKNELIRNFEKLKDKVTIYTFAQKSELEAYLTSNNLNKSAVEEIPMTLEDAFIGITGKY